MKFFSFLLTGVEARKLTATILVYLVCLAVFLPVGVALHYFAGEPLATIATAILVASTAFFFRGIFFFKMRGTIYGTESHRLKSLSKLMPTGEKAPSGEQAKVGKRKEIGTLPEARFGTESHRLDDLSSLTLQAN